MAEQSILENQEKQAGSRSESSPETTGLNTVQILSDVDNAKALPRTADTASQHLPADISIDDTKPVKKDDSGNIKEYKNGDYTVSKHDDGKWYYNQMGSATYVKVDENSIKMDEQGKVTFNESGFLGKHDQVLGNGNPGLIASVTDVVSDVVEHVAEHPLDTLNTIALPQLALVDAVAGTHIIEAVEQIEKGAVNEVIHNPKEVLKTVAIGAGIAALVAVTGGGALAAIAIGGAYFAADELIKNKGDINGVVNDVKSIGETFQNWGESFVTVAGTGTHSQEELAKAEQGLQQFGAFGTHTIAGIAGGIAGEAAVSIAGLNRSIPAAASAIPEKEVLPTKPVIPKAPQWMQEHFPNASQSILEDGRVIWTAAEDSGWTISATTSESGELGGISLISPEGELVPRKLSNPKALNELLENGTADLSLSENAVLLRTRNPETMHYLVLPKDGVTGIEDPRVYLDNAPNYFEDALDHQFIKIAKQLDVKSSAQILEQNGMTAAEAQDYAQFVVDHYRPDMAVTVNSPYSRSQELLHLHLNHIDPKVYGELAKIAEQNGFSKTAFESIGDLVPGEAENLSARWISADAQGSLGGANPFKLVYESLPEHLKPTIDEHSIAVVPLKYQNADGFLIIDGKASGNGAALEWLQHATAWNLNGVATL